ncbi:MAG: ATP-binding domain-containing protein, partial [Myxococcales bacterium]|nr:ATP-binding domain-containing protein [Myxococcales bacterium]
EPLVAAMPDVAALRFAGVEHLPGDSATLRRFFDRWYRERVRGSAEHVERRARVWPHRDGRIEAARVPALAPLFAHLEAARLLCLTRSYEAGADPTNERLHARAARDARLPADVPFVVGEPVLMQHNDYERGLYNGDQGVVLWVEGERGRQKAAVFADAEGYRAWPLNTLDAHLGHAYAMTVHKAQGSEYDAVALLLPADDLPLSTRELLYTGVTRARRSVVLIGDPARLIHAIGHPTVRHSGLAARLASPGPAAEGDLDDP